MVCDTFFCSSWTPSEKSCWSNCAATSFNLCPFFIMVKTSEMNSQQPRVQGVAKTLLSRFSSAFLARAKTESGKKSEGKQVETPPSLLAVAADGTFLWKDWSLIDEGLTPDNSLPFSHAPDHQGHVHATKTWVLVQISGAACGWLTSLIREVSVLSCFGWS